MKHGGKTGEFAETIEEDVNLSANEILEYSQLEAADLNRTCLRAVKREWSLFTAQ